MPNAGTFELVLRRLAEALEPVGEELTVGFLYDLGAGIPASWRTNGQLTGAFQSVGSAARALPASVTALSTAIGGGNELDIIAKGVALGAKIAEVAATGVQLGTVLNNLTQGDGALSGPQKAYLQQLANSFFPRMLETMVVKLLEQKLPQLFGALELLGFVEKSVQQAGSGDAVQPPFVRRSIHLDRLVQLFQSPATYAADLTDWGKPGFDGEKLFQRLQKLTKPLNIPAEIIRPGGQPPILEAFLLSLQTNPAYSPPALGFEFRIPGSQTVEQVIPLAAPWALKLGFAGSFAAGIRGVLEPPGAKLTIQPPSGSLEMTVSADLTAKKDSGLMLLVGLPGGTRLEANTITFGLGLKTTWNSGSGNAEAAPVAFAAIEGGKLTLDFGGADGFISKILPLEKAEATFSLRGDFAPTGVRLQGSGGLELVFPAHISLGPLDINRIYFLGKIFDPQPLALELSSALSLKLGPLSASVDRIGATIGFNLPANGKGNLGPLDLAIGFKPPNGVGLAIDAGVVKGGGYLYFDFEREEYAGVLQLNIAGFVSISAIALITTKMPDGSKGFSLLVIMSVEFSPGIQLGFGFTFLGVGGLLGLNRTVKLEVLAQGIRTGTLNNIMFPQGDIIANAPRIISDLKAIFPPQEGVFLVGPMVKLGWGTPTLISVALGVILEIPGNFAIVGVIKVAIPTVDAPLILIQVAFIGAVEFDKKRLWFFASMYESRVVFITLEGEFGLLVGWGDDANFVISVGGFNPRFNPPPLPFPNPRRIAIDILRTPASLIRLEGYFAVTSNTVQLGAHVELRFGLDEVGIKGHFGFDALFQFSPFYFIIEISASVSLQVFGMGLFSIRLKFSLEGPTPYRAKGTGTLTLLFFEISADFDVTWGEKQDTSLPPIAVLPLLEAELQKLENWRAELPAANQLGVALRKLEDDPETLVLHPLGVLRISQRLLPLDITLDKLGNQAVSDAKRFTLVAGAGGLAKQADAQERFATAQFQKLTDTEKLTRPAFENQHAGLDLAVAGNALRTSRMTRRTVRYEEIIIDSNFKRFVRRFQLMVGVLFGHWLRGNAVAKAAVSQATKKQTKPFGQDVIRVKGDQFTVAFQDTNRPYKTEFKEFSSEALAREFLAKQVAETPALESSLHVIPLFEANLQTEDV
ncbi:MAG: hypothetical protein H6555_08965 [Lewinellaceae bacterium]|nr:hypothetical protein [Lewinellaceae bacterium]